MKEEKQKDRTPLQPNQFPAASGHQAEAALPEPPRTLAEIPRLGPIRVRALQKAGLNNPVTLRNATIEQLLEVPGLTEVKAGQLRSYMQQFSVDTLKQASQAIEKENVQAVPKVSEPACGADSLSPLYDARVVTASASRVMGEIITLLLSPNAANLRSRLLRELGRLAQQCEMLSVDSIYLKASDMEKAARRLKRAAKELTDFSLQVTDKKAQQRLSDSLTEICDKLVELDGKAKNSGDLPHKSDSDAVKEAEPRSQQKAGK